MHWKNGTTRPRNIPNMDILGPTHLAAQPRQHMTCHQCISYTTTITAALTSKLASLPLLLLLDSLITAAKAINVSLILNLRVSLANMRSQIPKTPIVSIHMLTPQVLLEKRERLLSMSGLICRSLLSRNDMSYILYLLFTLCKWFKVSNGIFSLFSCLYDKFWCQHLNNIKTFHIHINRQFITKFSILEHFGFWL